MIESIRTLPPQVLPYSMPKSVKLSGCEAQLDSAITFDDCVCRSHGRGIDDGAVSKSRTFVDRAPGLFVRRRKIFRFGKRADPESGNERAVVRRVSDSVEANSALAHRNDSRWKPDGH